MEPFSIGERHFCDSPGAALMDQSLHLAEICDLAKTRSGSYNITTEFILRPVAPFGDCDGPQAATLLIRVLFSESRSQDRRARNSIWAANGDVMDGCPAERRLRARRTGWLSPLY